MTAELRQFSEPLQTPYCYFMSASIIVTCITLTPNLHKLNVSSPTQVSELATTSALLTGSSLIERRSAPNHHIGNTLVERESKVFRKLYCYTGCIP